MKIKFKGIQIHESEKVCFICRNQQEDGIIVGKSLICKSCQDKIVNTNIDNKQYDFYKDKIKKALFSNYNL
ncbi:sigma factor G inhibitor Gin [Clostridium chauvoei]|uniref:Inhibitor of sigma-G Gin n=2 Tax=Clostridium chauvoei TaxID=46867 RepID=S6EUP9_9CLOT|nr:sigma factor G inhibitor Gin [Clostridium chauvoei]ATD53895.1 hypothetical protein BTM20_00945 [Clostridium chauvoei]ATD58300.1 hypothetical protein BTM21_11370 [Clostridium chauvoei]MBX7280539.1 sigma factor G inhibitor Gin [Clostridium chauvoei]MBX7283133.1 sigma factor G inhibitor Gin [Clostridium chauvoei]MBX7285337.1 sigma factor G inhibitor Gin [Clostridium chauvoei]